MKKYGLIFIMSLLVCVTMKAQECERYIEVTGTSEMEVVPDEIHYLIEIQEYFEEEFDGVSKPEQYKTKVPITRIEQELMPESPTQLYAFKNMATIGDIEGMTFLSRNSWTSRCRTSSRLTGLSGNSTPEAFTRCVSESWITRIY